MCLVFRIPFLFFFPLDPQKLFWLFISHRQLICGPWAVWLQSCISALCSTLVSMIMTWQVSLSVTQSFLVSGADLTTYLVHSAHFKRWEQLNNQV